MRKNTNSFSDGNRSVKRVLGAGSRVGMAALIAASATSPVMSLRPHLRMKLPRLTEPTLR